VAVNKERCIERAKFLNWSWELLEDASDDYAAGKHYAAIGKLMLVKYFNEDARKLGSTVDIQKDVDEIIGRMEKKDPAWAVATDLDHLRKALLREMLDDYVTCLEDLTIVKRVR